MSVNRARHLLPRKTAILQYFRTKDYHKQPLFEDKYEPNKKFEIDDKLVQHMIDLREWKLQNAPTEVGKIADMQALNQLQNEQAYILYRSKFFFVNNDFQDPGNNVSYILPSFGSFISTETDYTRNSIMTLWTCVGMIINNCLEIC